MNNRALFVITISAFLIIFAYEPGICGKEFPTTYKEFALPDSELPKVIASHPRLFLRSEKWSHGPSLIDLKEQAKIPPLKNYLERKPWDKRSRLEWAFRYLVTGDEELVTPIIQEIKKEKGYWPGYLTNMALIYDWLYSSPSLEERDREYIEQKMVDWAEKAIVHGQRYQDMWSHYGYGPVTDLAAAGLALYGHRPEAKDFIAMAGGYMKNNFMPGWELNEGAWQGGAAYYSQGPANLIKLVALWSSATNENLYEIIEKEQGDWLRKHLYYLLSSTYPGDGPLDTVGFSYSPYIKGALDGQLPLTYAYHDSRGIYAQRSLEKVPWWAGIWQFLFYPPQMWGEGDKETLPLTQIWGRDGIGYVQMRSGWEKEDTIIDFKSGDYFWSHQFQNQNSFTIYKKGRLVLQSGMYEKYYGRHMLSYYRPTISANTILIVKPGETSWVPANVANNSKIVHKNGYFKNWGGQRVNYMLPELGSAENCFSYDKYLYRKNNDHHFETGKIEAFEIGPDYSYVYGDATDAYNNPDFSYPGNSAKIDLFTRELLFLDKKYVIIFDRVNSIDPAYQKIWLLHTIGQPVLEAPPEKIEISGHIETFPAGSFRIDLPNSHLLGRTLFSEEYTARRIGGGADLKEIKADPENKGSGSLKPEIDGRFEPLSASLATDYALADSWVLEFIDDGVYTVTGKRIGVDGQGKYKGPKSPDFLSRSRSLFIPARNWQGKPRKGDRFYFTVESPSYRFWVDGVNYPPDPNKVYGVIKDGSKIHPGNWRIEVSPRKAANYNIFLHLLYPVDLKAEKLPLIDEIQSDSGFLKGLVVDQWAIVFAAKELALAQDAYNVKRRGMIRQRMFGLRKNSDVRVDISEENVAHEKSLEMRVSEEGTLNFEATCPCRVELRYF